MESTIGRRELLIRGGIAGAGAVTAVALDARDAHANGVEDGKGPIGAWLVTVQRAGGVTLYDLVALGGDGVLTESDLGGAKTTAGMGEWRRVDGQTIRSVFSKLFTDNQGRLPKLLVTATFSLDSPDSFTGSGTAIASEFPSGAVVARSNQTLHGVRIGLE